MPKIQANGINIYYETHGKGDPLLLICGFAIDHLAWEVILEPLTKKFQVITFDNRGVGQSDIPQKSYTLDDMAEDTKALLEVLGIKKAHVLGESMGGAIAQILAAKYPQMIDKLILCSTFPKLDPAPAFVFHAALKLLIKGADQDDVIQTCIPWIFSNNFFAEPQKLLQFFHMVKSNPFPQPFDGFKGQLEALFSFDSHPFLHKISHKTLVVVGELDILSPVSDAKVLTSKIPSSKLHIVPDVGHAINMENPVALPPIVLEFLG